MADKADFYVYLHTKPATGEVYYVGKGRGNRAWAKNRRNFIWKRFYNKHGLKIVFHTKNLNEEAAYDLEIELIKSYLAIGQARANMRHERGGGGRLGRTDEDYKKMGEKSRATLIKNGTSVGENNPMYGKDWRVGKTEAELIEHSRKLSEAMYRRTSSPGYKHPCAGIKPWEHPRAKVTDYWKLWGRLDEIVDVWWARMKLRSNNFPGHGHALSRFLDLDCDHGHPPRIIHTIKEFLKNNPDYHPYNDPDWTRYFREEIA